MQVVDVGARGWLIVVVCMLWTVDSHEFLSIPIKCMSGTSNSSVWMIQSGDRSGLPEGSIMHRSIVDMVKSVWSEVVPGQWRCERSLARH